MRSICGCLIILSFAAKLQGQSFITVISPSPYQVNGSSLSIQVHPYSPNGIKQMVASIGGRSTPVIYNPGEQFSYGTLNLSGLEQDTLQLQIVATDSLNNTDTVVVPIIYDLPPTIAVDSPLNWSVASPTLPIKARCSDNSPHCNIVVTLSMGGNFNIPYETFQDSVNATIDLSSYDGNSGYILYTAVDKYNQTAQQSSQVFVESSPYLQELYGGTDQIMDFNYNKVFITNTNFARANQNTNYIQDITTKDSIAIPFVSASKANITPYGAMMMTDSTDVLRTLHEWNTDTLYELPGYPYDFKVAGNYACWSSEDDRFFFRDLSSKTNFPVPAFSHPPVSGFDLSANGSVVCSITDSNYHPNIFRYINGSTSAITDNSSSDSLLYNPLTDGSLTVYAKAFEYPNFNKIYLQNGDSSILLSDLGQTSINPYPHLYEVNNGFVTYVVPDSLGILQIWLRDSIGNTSQRSHFTGPGSLELMDSHGDFTFSANETVIYPVVMSSNYRFFSSRSGSIQKVSSGLGTAYFSNNSYYIVIGRMLYKLNVSIPPNTVDTSAISTSKDSAYFFTTTDFTNQFKGPGALMQVQITSLPLHGTLYLSGIPVTSGQQIPRISLSSLSFTPDSSFVQDSIGWNGSNGYTYTNSNGLIILSDGIPVPVISGLQSSYCSNQGTQKIKILNPPSSHTAYITRALLDNNSLPVSADSSFQIPLSTLSGGTHYVQVIYATTIDSQQIKDSFILTTAVTPVITISSDPATISNTNLLVIVTVNNISGGGANPQFSFAKDNLFTNILQGPASTNILGFSGSILQSGNNWIYAKMQSSDSCVTKQYAIDSINIRKTAPVGLIDPDFPDQVIAIFPNPFSYQISISGLQLTKSYGISLTDIAGRQITQQTISNSQVATIIKYGISGGVYVLKIYDETKGRTIGTVSLVKP